jgi:hypothetical protein
MKWWYYLVVAIVVAVVVFAYLQFGHTQMTATPSPSPTAFNRATQPFSSPTSSPTPVTKLVPPPIPGMPKQ